MYEVLTNQILLRFQLVVTCKYRGLQVICQRKQLENLKMTNQN